LELKLQKRDDELAAARAADRELMAQLNRHAESAASPPACGQQTFLPGSPGSWPPSGREPGRTRAGGPDRGLDVARRQHEEAAEPIQENRLGFAMLLKPFEVEAQFPDTDHEARPRYAKRDLDTHG